MPTNNRNESFVKYISDFIQDLLHYWYVFVISLVFTCGVAVFYVKYAAKTYKIKASVLLKTERSNAYGGRADDILKVYELI